MNINIHNNPTFLYLTQMSQSDRVDLKKNNVFEYVLNRIFNLPTKLGVFPSIQHTPHDGNIPEPTRGLNGMVIICAQQCGNYIGFEFFCKNDTNETKSLNVTININLNKNNINFTEAKTFNELPNILKNNIAYKLVLMACDLC